ncbi:MAG: 2-C-methyl-D-erythritol 2,4-cyclodiphosphate synthase, partial [Chloroflexi bacterium CG08_land_8_20_14_0_20_45_12]
ITDDAAAVERSGYKVKLYMGDYNNIKVTTPEDLALAETIAGKSGVKNLSSMRVGIGYDSHALASERKLILGGVDIPHNMGLLGWSDADVVIHAIIDALCGAAGLGDIGTLFPPEEPEYQNISSLVLLTETDKLARAKGFTVVNIDATIMAQYPKLSPFIPEMKKRISQALGIESSQVTIKATTTNGLGFIGRGEGMAAQSVALVEG